MGIMTEYHSLPNTQLLNYVRMYQAANENRSCLPNGLLEEIIQRLEILEDTLEENGNDD